METKIEDRRNNVGQKWTASNITAWGWMWEVPLYVLNTIG